MAHVDPTTLPETVARYAEAQVVAGNFASIDDVLSAGVEVLQQREQDWLDYARGLWTERTAAAERAEFSDGEPEEILARVRARVEPAR